MANALKRKSGLSKVESSPDRSIDSQELRQRISEAAYYLYLNRGQVDGYDLVDWLQAEQTILAELGPMSKKQKSSSDSSQRRLSKQTV